MSNGEQPVGKTKWKQGGFDKVKNSDKSTYGSTSAEPQDIEMIDVANVKGGQLIAGASLGDISDSVPKREVNKFAGQHCQAPKGDGICGAVLSRYNPHPVPICQPCAERLSNASLHRGESPDLEEIWRRIVNKQDKARLEDMASRTSGVQETTLESKTRSTAAAKDAIPKASVA
jgi:hypothetical protein